MNKLKIGKMILGVCGTNCYYIYREENKNGSDLIPAIVVDPADDGERIYHTMKEKGLSVEGILLTHGHVDHILGIKELKELTGAKVYAGSMEEELLKDLSQNLSMMFQTSCRVYPDVLLKDGEKCEIAGIECKVIATPGHTIGSTCYYFETDGLLISGDTLFDGSVGRTDFPTGSMSVLVRSIKEKLFKLPDRTIVYPGHGGSTTIGWEKENNPFVI